MSRASDDLCSESPDDCSKAVSMVDMYIDGVLEVDDRTFIQRHLDDCPGCKDGYEFETAFHLRLRSLAPVFMPDDVKSQIMLALGFPGMSSPMGNSMSAMGSPDMSIDPDISSQMGIPRTEIPRGEIPKHDFFDNEGPSS